MEKVMKCRNCKYGYCEYKNRFKKEVKSVECVKFKSKLSSSQYKNLGTCLFYEER